MYEEENLVVEESVDWDTNPLKGKFCWAGLIMPQFWGLGNGIGWWILAWIPVAFPIMALVYGISGYDFAFEKIKYSEKRKTFVESQKKWNIAAVIYLIIVIGIIVACL
ncbi:MAG: hypothetical protein IKY23_11170 [Lachnospiraceae bacterium]|nr:hypothetical protein [Lachnospiraceae bacterium]